MNKVLQGLAGALLMVQSCVTGNAEAADGIGNWKEAIPDYKEAEVSITENGPTLVFSDSPEMVTDCGVMYRDTVNGPVRVFFHHVNDTSTEKKLAVVLKNVGVRPVEVTVGRRGVSKPDTDWMAAGKAAQQGYFHKDTKENFTLKIREKREFLTGKTGVKFRPQELITGIVDFTFSRPVEISFMMIPVSTDFDAAVDVYNILPADKGGHVLRGTFKTSDCHVAVKDVFDTDKNEIWGITLADNESNPYVRGIDATTGDKVINYGNYGVVYDLSYKTKGERDTIVRFNPWGGYYAGAGTLVNGTKPDHVMMPKGRMYFGNKSDAETIVLGKTSKGKTGEVWFSPPGSSNLPVRVFLEPVKKS